MDRENENKYNKQVFANNLKYYLQEKGVTQKELAETLGMSQGAVTDWVKLRNYPRMDAVQKLAEFFGIEKSDLVEDRSVKSKYYLHKEIKRLETVMVNSPESVDLYLAIEQLSDANKAIVKALVESLSKGEN
jgi:transcriptional regulator with XRE-family HTH domain